MKVAHALLAITLTVVISESGQSSDWTMWRYDAGHTAASPGKLPDRLHLQWTREFGRREQVWDDPLNHDLMPYDKVLEPVAKDGRLFVGFNNADKVIAFNLKSGQQL